MPKILVLDDSREDRFFLRFALKEALPDADFFEFAYAEDALAFLRTPDRPSLDLLFVDISMPRMTGFEFADAFMELYPELRGSAPVYVMSGSLDPDDASRAKAHAAVSDYIKKPVSTEVVARIVDHLPQST